MMGANMLICIRVSIWKMKYYTDAQICMSGWQSRMIFLVAMDVLIVDDGYPFI